MLRLIGGITLLFWSASTLALEVQLSRTVAVEGDTIELNIIDEKPIPNVDFTPLSSNFMMGGQHRSQSSSFVNGVGSTQYSIGVILYPIKTGTLQIPSFQVGNQRTDPQTITVKPRGEKSPQSNPDSTDVTLNSIISDTNPYVGQTILYTLQLENSAAIMGGEIIPPNMEQFRLSPIGNDHPKTIRKNGTNIPVIERTYALTLTQSGQQHITPALFNGNLLIQQKPKSNHKFMGLASAGDLFGDFFAASHPIQIASNTLNLNIQEQPKDWMGWWLPSSDVQLTATYTVPNELQTGDTIQVDLNLSAWDVDGNDLPVPKFDNAPNWRIYPEPEERTTTITKDGHIKGHIHVRYSLLPQKVGNQTLPNCQIPWFNTKTKQREIARLEEKTISITGNDLQMNESPVNESQTPVIQEEIKTPIAPISQPKSDNTFWSGLITGMGGFALLAIIIHLIRRKKKPQEIKEKKKPIPDFYPF